MRHPWTIDHLNSKLDQAFKEGRLSEYSEVMVLENHS